MVESGNIRRDGCGGLATSVICPFAKLGFPSDAAMQLAFDRTHRAGAALRGPDLQDYVAVCVLELDWLLEAGGPRENLPSRSRVARTARVVLSTCEFGRLCHAKFSGASPMTFARHYSMPAISSRPKKHSAAKGRRIRGTCPHQHPTRAAVFQQFLCDRIPGRIPVANSGSGGSQHSLPTTVASDSHYSLSLGIVYFSKALDLTQRSVIFGRLSWSIPAHRIVAAFARVKTIEAAVPTLSLPRTSTQSSTAATTCRNIGGSWCPRWMRPPCR